MQLCMCKRSCRLNYHIDEDLKFSVFSCFIRMIVRCNNDKNSQIEMKICQYELCRLFSLGNNPLLTP